MRFTCVESIVPNLELCCSGTSLTTHTLCLSMHGGRDLLTYTTTSNTHTLYVSFNSPPPNLGVCTNNQSARCLGSMCVWRRAKRPFKGPLFSEHPLLLSMKYLYSLFVSCHPITRTISQIFLLCVEEYNLHTQSLTDLCGDDLCPYTRSICHVLLQ